MARIKRGGGSRFPTKGNLKAGELGQHQVMYSEKAYGDRGEMKAKPSRSVARDPELTKKVQKEKSGSTRKWTKAEVAAENAKRKKRLAERKRATTGGIKDDPSNTKGETKPKRIGAVRRAFARVPLAAFRLGGGGGGGAGRK